MSDTPARELQQSSLMPSQSCVSINSTPKNQDFSKVRLPFSTVRLPTQDQFSRNKIMQLQEELIKQRKDYSQMECSHSKEKSSLLNRIQLLSEENTELKHRIESLTQLNLTLQLAMNSQEQSKSRIAMKEDNEVCALKQQMGTLTKTLKQYKMRVEEYKKYIRRLEEQKYQLLEEKDRKILELNNTNKQIQQDKEELQNKMKGLINKRYSNQQMVNAIQKALNYHTQDLSLDDAQIQSNYFEESPIPKRKGQPDRRVGGRSSKAFDSSYSRISSRSFINQLNHPIPSECSYQEEEEPQRLLCEICRKVYEQEQFLRHMDQCREISHLHKKRQQLENAIHNLDQQQRKSISQRKVKQNIEQRQPLHPIYYENYHKDKSQSKFMDKSPYRTRPEAAKKIVVQLNRQEGQGYRSNKYY